MEMHELLKEHLKIAARCPLCRSKYDPLEARMIPVANGGEFVHVQCASCHGAVVARVASTPSGVTSIGVVSDCTAADVARLHERQPINANDVLAVHTSLSRTRGDVLQEIVK